MTTSHRATFLREWIRAPLTVAAVAPSGKPLAGLITAPVPRGGNPLVVELGPGTGSFTAAIQNRLAGRGHHVAVELNERFAGLLAARYPRVEVTVGDAGDLGAVLAARGHGQADVIVSGLPWAAFDQGKQDRLMGAVTDALTPDGVFTTFGYTFSRWNSAARRLRGLLDDRFEEVVTGRTVWANVPPAFVHFCRRPRVAARSLELISA